MQCNDGSSILFIQRYVRKGNDAKEPSNFQVMFSERTQFNATHAQLLEKLRPIRNLPISNDPVVRISRNLAKK